MAMITHVAAQQLTLPESIPELAKRAGWTIEATAAAGAGRTRHRVPAGVSQIELICDAVSQLHLSPAQLSEAQWLISLIFSGFQYSTSQILL